MAAVDVTLALGTNLGDRQSNIRVALNLLDLAFGSHYTALSPIIETKACGFEGPDFLNCVVRYRSARRPQTILKLCKGVEKAMGRDDEPEYDERGERVYHDRIIDIDILYCGRVRMDTPELKIPHPQVESRAYIKELLLFLQD